MTLRDEVEVELKGAVDEHERIRTALKRIDASWPGAGDFTLEIRHALMAVNHRYGAIRQSLAKEQMLGRMEPPTVQRSVGTLELFADQPAELSAGERERMVQTLHRVGDDSLDTGEVEQ